MQVDLIDMTSRPDNNFRYIIHAADHFNKIFCVCPSENRKQNDVVSKNNYSVILFI